jgi:hypothetical protein
MRRPSAVPDGAVPVSAQWGGVSASLDVATTKWTHLWLAAENGAGSTATTSVPLGSIADGTGARRPHERIPTSVWVVIGLFVTTCAGVSVAWIAWLRREPPAGRRATQQKAVSPPPSDTTFSLEPRAARR